jgi:hypothetical protein
VSGARARTTSACGTSDDPQLPFFVTWLSDDEHHPAAGGSSVRLTGLQIAGEEQVVDEYLGTAARQPLDGIEVVWLDGEDGERGVVSATFATHAGPVTLD